MKIKSEVGCAVAKWLERRYLDSNSEEVFYWSQRKIAWIRPVFNKRRKESSSER